MPLVLVLANTLLGHNVHGNGSSRPVVRANDWKRIVHTLIPPGGACADIPDATEDRGRSSLVLTPERTGEWVPSLLITCACE